MTPEQIIAAMLPHLTLDLAPPKWQRLARKHNVKTLGFGTCYPAAEVLYYLWGKANGFKPCYKKDGTLQHWFLRHPDGRVLDPSANQFEGRLPDYAGGRCCGFLTKGLSKRAAVLLGRMGMQ
ncbi:Uncharacterised protein [uncultured archaeon]|nr:Uncharacterised protein [uncultured archaeon]